MKDKLIKITAFSIPILISSISILTIIGWYVNHIGLTSWIAGAQSMKFPTAIGLIIASIILFLSSDLKEKKLSNTVIVSLCSNLLLTLVVLQIIVSGMAHSLLWKEMSALDMSGFSSVLTLFVLTLISIAGLIICFNTKMKYKRLEKIGTIIAICGILPILGYIFQEPILYFSGTEISKGISLNSAVCFLLFAAGLKINCHKLFSV